MSNGICCSPTNISVCIIVCSDQSYDKKTEIFHKLCKFEKRSSLVVLNRFKALSGDDGKNLKKIFNDPISLYMIKLFKWSRMKGCLLKLNEGFKSCEVFQFEDQSEKNLVLQEKCFHIMSHNFDIMSLLSTHCALLYCKVSKKILTVDPDI